MRDIMVFSPLRAGGSIISLILLVVALFVCPTVHALDQPVEDAPGSLDVIMLIDNSTSMIGNDPDGLRVRAAKFLVDYLRANAEAMGTNYWVGVANFGREIGDTVSLHLLQDDTIRDRIHEERLGQTDFHPPLQFARNELRRDFDSGKKMAVILFTDGRPQLTGTPMTEDELQSYFGDLVPLVNELQNRDVSLFVLGIGDAQKDRDNWMRLIPKEHYIL